MIGCDSAVSTTIVINVLHSKTFRPDREFYRSLAKLVKWDSNFGSCGQKFRALSTKPHLDVMYSIIFNGYCDIMEPLNQEVPMKTSLRH